MLGVGELIILGIGALLVVKFINRRHGCGESRIGFGSKLLGVMAVAAGLAVFWVRAERHDNVFVEHPTAQSKSVFSDTKFRSEAEFAQHWPEGKYLPRPGRRSDSISWLSIALGSALVIVGVLLFGRERTRPMVMKAATLLGVGAVVYVVATFFAHPPSLSQPAMPRVVRLETDHGSHEVRIPRDTVPSRARRPAIRPERPAPGSPPSEELPPRAGEIPVHVEVAAAAPQVDVKVVEPMPDDPFKPAPIQPAAEQPPVTATPLVMPPPPTTAPPADPAPSGSSPTPVPPTTVPPAPVPPATTSPATTSHVTAEPKAPAATPPSPPLVQNASATATVPVPALPKQPHPSQPRPDWVDQPASSTGRGVFALPVRSGVWTEIPECQRELEIEIRKACDHYIEQYLGDGSSELVNLPWSYIQDHIKRGEYTEVVQSMNVGEMYQLHARLEFDNQARADFHRRRDSAEVANRLWYTAGGAALVLALLSTLYGYLRLDLRTGGAHKGRLQLAATLVALIACAGVLLIRWGRTF